MSDHINYTAAVYVTKDEHRDALNHVEAAYVGMEERRRAAVDYQRRALDGVWRSVQSLQRQMDHAWRCMVAQLVLSIILVVFLVVSAT